MPDYLPRIITPAKIAVLLAILIIGPWTPFFVQLDYFLSTGRYPQAAIFTLIIIICLIAIIVAPFLKPAILRVPLAALMVFGVAINEICLHLSGNSINPAYAAMIWRERGMIGDAIAGYPQIASLTAALVVPAILILAWKPAPSTILRTRWATLPAAALLSSLAVVNLTYGGTREFPPPFSVPGVMAFAIASQPHSEPRDEIPAMEKPHRLFRHIVMIVDESVRGDQLQINNPAQASTPFLAGNPKGLSNFGVAVSVHNCSAESRLILRTGLKITDLPDLDGRAFKVPSIWQFARHAGFKTVLIDAFADVFDTHSYMTESELTFIDKKIPVGGNPTYLRDQKIATEILPALLAGEKPVFVYVNKYGAHYPYSHKYPAGFDDNGKPAEDDLNDRDKLVENYHHAVRWSVDEFFRNLLAHIDLKDTLILYTSDHGQSLLEGGYKQPHCTDNIRTYSDEGIVIRTHPGEGIVPLFALSDNSQFAQALKKYAQINFGKATHYNIFPTLLLAMGYDGSWVAEGYGAALTQPLNNDERRFLTGNIFARHSVFANPDANWIQVD